MNAGQNFETTPATEDLKTRHLMVRCQQRGIRDDAIDLVLSYADKVEKSRGDRLVWMTAKSEREAIQDGFPLEIIERAKRLVVVVGASGMLVTAFRSDRNRRGFRDERRKRGSRRRQTFKRRF